MAERLMGNEYWISTVYIDSYDDGVPKGRIENPFYDDAQPFESLTQFLSIMECTLDLTKLPQSFTSQRAFANVGSYEPKKYAHRKCDRGKLASFSLCIRFRQNSSWQGSFQWLDGGKGHNFRSTLEMILLLDSALRTTLRRQEEGTA